ncbi:MAG TPA: anthranilate synthase component I [Pyrinomonadaceae bacterium]
MLDLQPSSFEQFVREARQGNVVPVVRSVLADLHTPLSVFLKICEATSDAFLLESVEGGERIARYSFLGVAPEIIVRGRANQTIVKHGDKEEVLPVIATEWVRDYFRNRSLARRPGLTPFAGGAVGYVGYEAAQWFESALRDDRTLAENASTDAVWMFFRTIIAFDHVRQRIEIVSVVLTEEAEGSEPRLRELYDQAIARTKRIEDDIFKTELKAPSSAPHKSAPEHRSLKSNWQRRDFEAAVRRVKEHIAAGDCYQVVLSQKFSGPFAGDPIQIYRALRAINPSPYMFFLRVGDESVVGASPEMLVRCHGQRLDYRPIAGTRKRGATDTEDWVLGEDLKSDEKEVAEHMMLVDLGRNDLGRVADYGSVKVEELMAIERYSHVQHLVTSLRARLSDGLDRFDALASCFPAGTVTGAPKIRAMEIIRELEPERRGLYAGCVLYMDYADNLDSCIAIRTIVLRDGEASVQAGAGIVADSVPEHEYAETVNKARAMFRAIEMAENGL